MSSTESVTPGGIGIVGPEGGLLVTEDGAARCSKDPMGGAMVTDM